MKSDELSAFRLCSSEQSSPEHPPCLHQSLIASSSDARRDTLGNLASSTAPSVPVVETSTPSKTVLPSCADTLGNNSSSPIVASTGKFGSNGVSISLVSSSAGMPLPCSLVQGRAEAMRTPKNPAAETNLTVPNRSSWPALSNMARADVPTTAVTMRADVPATAARCLPGLNRLRVSLIPPTSDRHPSPTSDNACSSAVGWSPCLGR
mmetsp:Transcript_15350/g.23903  ORF Transcript_15350/g.23903 Transcript_15350/m.23903 type:complete len:207 (-) Transcript_15350:220-840(-)